MRSITVEIRTIDGEDQIIPICADARCFARMLGSTVLTFDSAFLHHNTGLRRRILSDARSKCRIALASAAS